MSNHTTTSDALTAFDWVLQQAQGTTHVFATAAFDKLDVPAFLELQAQAMRNHGYRAAVTCEGPGCALIWTPEKNLAPGVADARFTVKAVDGTNRPFRAQFKVPSAIEDGTHTIVGCASHHLDQKVLSRWFTVFVDQSLAAAAVRAESAAA